jgi:hypothetical protein
MVEVLRLRTHGVGPRFVEAAFAGVEDTDGLSWQEARDVFDRAGGPYSYGLTEELRRLGHDVVDIVLDLVILRRAWEREHGPLRTDMDQRQALALAAIEVLRPRIVIDLNMKTFSVAELMEMRRRSPSVEGTIGVANVMKRLDRVFGHDLVLTPSRPLVRTLRRIGGPSAELFHHAFEPPAAGSRTTSDREHAAVFSGSVGHGVYARRRELLRRLLSEGLVEAWVKEGPGRPGKEPMALPSAPAPRPRWHPFVPLGALPALTRLTGRGSDLLDERLRETVAPGARTAGPAGPPGPPLRDEFPDRCHPAVFGAEMFDLLGRSRTVVHDEVNGAATSLRLFEATGMGAALVTDATDGLAELFEVGTEVLTYRTIDEALDLVRALRDDPALAGRVGAAGRARTHRDHSVTARAQQLDALLRDGALVRRRAVRSPQPTAARSAA